MESKGGGRGAVVGGRAWVDFTVAVLCPPSAKLCFVVVLLLQICFYRPAASALPRWV